MTQTVGKGYLRPESYKDDQWKAYKVVIGIVSDYLETHGSMPVYFYASDHSDLQSLIMWAAQLQGLKPMRTSKRNSYASAEKESTGS